MTFGETAGAIAGDPRVEAARDAAAPIWFASADGRRVLWCNAAGAAVLGWRDPAGELPARTAAALARVGAGLAVGGASRLAMLRIGTAGAFAAMPCRCARHVLADGSRVLVVEALSVPPGLRMPPAVASGEGTFAAASVVAEARPLPPIETIDIVDPGLLGEPLVAAESALPAPAPAIEAEAAPEPEPPIRFVFETDADARITFLSPEAVTAIGQTATRLFARPWSEAAGELGLDPEGKVEAALGRRDTWSGVTIDWIFADGRRRPVALSALPIFDQDRKFRGYRGFGVCRGGVPATAPASSPVPVNEEPALLPETVARPAEAAESKVIDFEARTGVRGAREAAADRSGLSASERSAFREIARALGTRGALAEEPVAEIEPAATAVPSEEPEADAYPPLPEELTALLELAADPALIVDARGSIARFSAAVPAFFGRSVGELRGASFTLLLAPESHETGLDYLEGVRGGIGSALFAEGREVLGMKRDGGPVPMLMRIGRMPEGDRLAIVLRDLSPWRKAEEELVSAKQRSDRASSQKSDFLAKISHEIRTPLNAIIGFSEVMSEERFGPVGNPRYREYLRDIRASGEHLVSLVNDLLDLSKIEAGKLDLNFASVDLNAVVQGCVAIMQPQSHARQIVIRTSFSRTLPPVVADQRSVRQIVLNLLSNAVKFTEAGGQVIIATALTDLGQAVIRVRDTGIGMSARDIETALEPFRQLVTATAGGTGLGLPLTKALVEANKATFAIESEVGEGTLVEVIFPPTRVLGE
jgi:PAS domain S-box-containing protein